MKALGKHVIIELYDGNRDILNSVEEIERILIEAVKISGATIIKPVFHKFSPHGVSGVVVIAESHFSIHTWPEYGYAAADFFTCGDSINTKKSVEYIRKELKAKKISIIQISRGILDFPEKKILHKPIMA